jgi:O-antigen ligase
MLHVKTKPTETLILRVLPFLMIFRVFVDGSLNFRIAGIQITIIIASLLSFMAISTFFTRLETVTSSLFVLCCALLASSYYGTFTWGQAGIAETIRTTGIFGIFLVAYKAKVDLSITKFFLGVRFASISIAIIALIQIYEKSGGVFVSGTWRYPGLMFSANTAAIFYVGNLLSEFTILKENKSKIRLISIGLSSIGLLQTYSFGGYILFVVSFFIKALLERSTGNSGKVFRQSLFVLFLAVLAYFFSSGIRAKFINAVVPVYDRTATGKSSVQWRLNAWTQLLEFFKEKPIFGQGFGSTRNLNMAGPFLPHNEYLRLLIEVGFVGLLLFLLFASKLISVLRNLYFDSRSPVVLFTCSYFIAFLVNAFSENTFTYTLPEYILAAALGFSFSNYRKTSNGRL